MLLRLLLGLTLGTGMAGYLYGQDVEEAPRTLSPFLLPTGNSPSDANPYPDTGAPPPSFERLPPAATSPALEVPTNYPGPGAVESHPLPSARGQRPQLMLPPPPTAYGTEEAPADPNPSRDDLPQPAEVALPQTEVRDARYEQSPGNLPVATDVQQTSATLAEPIVSIPAAATGATEPLKLAPPSKTERELKPLEAPNNSQLAITVVASLAGVIGLFLLVAWGTKKALPGGTGRLPTEVLEPLGRLPVTSKTELQLLRLGSKLVLVSSNGGSMDTVCEVTDPLEVERLLALCRKQKPNSSTVAFRETLSQVSAEPVRGFAGEFARANPGGTRRG